MEGSGALNIKVTNFGPIVEADVDLRPFTLFVGPSNTGKSYLAIMIYALHQLFGESSAHFPPTRGSLRHRHHLWGNRPKDEALLPDDAANDFLDWAQRMLSEEAEVPNPLPEKIAALLRSLLESVEAPDEFAGDEIAHCFGLESPAQLVRSPGRTGAQVVLRRYVGTGQKGEEPFVHQLDISKQGTVRFSASIPANQPLWYRGDLSQWMLSLEREIWTEQGAASKEGQRLAFSSIDDLVGAVFPHIIGPVGSPAYYLPAGRTGVMHAHRVVVSSMLRSATIAGIRPVSAMPMLSGVLADFLEQLIAFGDMRGRKRHGKEALATQLEKTILEGAVRLEESAESESYPSFSYHPTGWKDSLPLMHASSMVSELAPVVLYLRHVVRPGDVLIIEEPESHLHPAMQVEFTRLLAAAVREGIRIIVTTHSEWVLEELANLVSASTLTRDDRELLKGDDLALEKHEVGAWLFEPEGQAKGSTVQEIELNSESGTFPSGYDGVAADLHNRWADISGYSE